MVTVLKDIPVPGIEVVPCRLNGPRGIVKSFVLHDERDLVVVDTGASDDDAAIIAERIRGIGRTPADVRACIITHRHTDHIGGLRALRALADFPVLAHAEEAAAIAERTGCAVDRVLADRDTLPHLGGLQIVHMPGHTPGSVAVHWPRHGALFAGDAIVSAGEHLMVSPAFLCVDPDGARASVRSLLDLGLDLRMVLVAHGEDVYTDVEGPLGRILLERRTF